MSDGIKGKIEVMEEENKRWQEKGKKINFPRRDIPPIYHYDSDYNLIKIHCLMEDGSGKTFYIEQPGGCSESDMK